MEDYYMVTVTDNMGNDMVAYVAAKDLREYTSMMSSEYGNVKVEQVNFEDIPADVATGFKK